MKNFLIIIIVLLVLIIGIQIGSSDDGIKAIEVKEKIEIFENDINNNNDINNQIMEGNILSILANKCMNSLDKIIENILNKITN